MLSRMLVLVLLVLIGGACSQGNQPMAMAAEESAPVAQSNSDSSPSSPSAAPGAAKDWPQWRGPNRDGISTETAWNARWPEDGPAKLWSFNVGTGFSSFAVANGRVYTLGHKDGDDTIYCLNAESGEPVWKHSYACKLVDNLHEGGPAATPTVDGDRVYTVSKEGHLFCFNAADGDILWQVELQKLLGVEMPEWGFSCSPLVLGEKLIVEAGRTAALNKATGELIWKTEEYRPGYGSPALWQVDGQQLITVLNNDCLLVVRAEDGEKIDEFPWETQFVTTSTTPIPWENTVFISTGYNQGCALLELKDGKLELVYENKNMRNHMNNCVLWQGHLYGFDGNSHQSRLVNLVCLDHRSGEVKWKEGGLGCGSLILAGDKLILLGDSGELATAEVSAEGYKQISRAQVLEGRCWTSPVLANGRIYCRNANGDVVCLDVRS